MKKKDNNNSITFIAPAQMTRTETFVRSTRMTRSIGYRFAYRFRRIRQIRRIEVEPEKPHAVWFSTHAVTRRRFLREI